MNCPTISDLPPPPPERIGWPWTVGSPPLPSTSPGDQPWARISIVTPSYNQGAFIEETIRSVLLQGYPDLEYIIVDGGSTDDTTEIIGKYARWLSHWIREPDRGQSHAINKGWRRSTGDYVSWLNSDDVLLPQSLYRAASALARDERLSIAYGHTAVCDESSHIHKQIKGRAFDLGVMLQRWTGPLTQPGFLMRRAVLDRVGFLNESLEYVMDFEYWVRIAQSGGKGQSLDHALAAIRRHSDTKSATIRKRCIADFECMYQQLFGNRNDLLAARSRAALDLRIASVAATIGEASVVRGYVAQHVRRARYRSSPSLLLYLALSMLSRTQVQLVMRLWRTWRYGFPF